MAGLIANFTTSPEQAANDRTNRLDAITKYNNLLDKYKTDFYKDKRHILPADLEEMKGFLRERLALLRKSTTLSTTALDALNNDPLTQKFEALQENFQARAEFATFFEDLQAEVDKAPLATTASEKVLAFKAFLLKANAWMTANKYLSSDEYEAKMDELLEAGSQLLDKRTLSATNVREWLQSVGADEEMKQDTFDVGDVFKKIFATAAGIVGVFLVILFGLLGSSLAMNMLIYRNAALRILAGVFGFIFFPFVLGYGLVRRFWYQKAPEFFAAFPFVEGKEGGLFTFAPLSTTAIVTLENIV